MSAYVKLFTVYSMRIKKLYENCTACLSMKYSPLTFFIKLTWFAFGDWIGNEFTETIWNCVYKIEGFAKIVASYIIIIILNE